MSLTCTYISFITLTCAYIFTTPTCVYISFRVFTALTRIQPPSAHCGLERAATSMGFAQSDERNHGTTLTILGFGLWCQVQNWTQAVRWMFLFFFISLKPWVEWFKILWALNTSPRRNCCTFLSTSGSLIKSCTDRYSPQFNNSMSDPSLRALWWP